MTLQPHVVTLPLGPRHQKVGLSSLTLDALFPDIAGMAARDPHLIELAGVEWRETTLRAHDGLWKLDLEHEHSEVWRDERWQRLSIDTALDLIRGGRVRPQQLELVFTRHPRKGWPADALEYWSFGPDEWELTGWSYLSDRKMMRLEQRLSRSGIGGSFGRPRITFHLRLLPKAVDLTDRRLLAFCGSAFPVAKRRS